MVAFFASEKVFFGLQVTTVEEVSRHYGVGFFFIALLYSPDVGRIYFSTIVSLLGV